MHVPLRFRGKCAQFTTTTGPKITVVGMCRWGGPVGPGLNIDAVLLETLKITEAVNPNCGLWILEKGTCHLWQVFKFIDDRELGMPG